MSSGGSETRITQVLTKDHTLDTVIQNGDLFLDTEDVFSHINRIEDDPLGRDSTSRMRAHGLYGVNFHERAKKLGIEFCKAVEFVPKTDLEFKGKRFCLLGFDYGYESRERIVNKLGGECVDLTCDQIDCFVFKGLYPVENDSIYEIQISQFDTEYDMYFEILQRKKKNPSIKILTREAFDTCTEEPLQELKKEEQRQKEETKRQREEERRQRAEEKAKLAEEVRLQREAQRRVREEAMQQAAEEKQRQQAARIEAKVEKERLAAEAKAQRELERQEAIANAVILYAPGEEPEKLRARLVTLFAKLDGAYPDRRISRLNQDHKNWGETVTELYRLLGYPDSQAFLEAYGYTIEKNAGGRPTSVDPAAIIEELHRRYPDGGAESMEALKRDNPDIPWKMLGNNAKEYFGTTLGSHLKNIGLIARK